MEKMAKVSGKKINNTLLKDIERALKNIKGWGSVEIYVQNSTVTQITERNIKKTNHELNEESRP